MSEHQHGGPAPYTYTEGAGPYDRVGPYATPTPQPPYPAQPEAAPADPGGFWQQQQAAAQQPPPAQQAPPPPEQPQQPQTPDLGAWESDSTRGSGAGDQDFDAWLAEFTEEQPKVKLFREWWPIPFDVPLWITNMVESGKVDSADLSLLTRMIDALYGEGAGTRMVSNGAGGMALSVVVAWSMLRAQGDKDVTFGQAMRRAEEMAAQVEQQQAQQKTRNDALSATAAQFGPNSAEARAAAAALEVQAEAGKAPSSASGPPWKPTSAGSTGSPGPSWQS